MIDNSSLCITGKGHRYAKWTAKWQHYARLADGNWWWISEDRYEKCVAVRKTRQICATGGSDRRTYYAATPQRLGPTLISTSIELNYAQFKANRNVGKNGILKEALFLKKRL